MASSRHTMQSNYIKRPTTGRRSLEIDAVLYVNCTYWLHCTIWRLEIPQCFLFFYYKKVLMIGFCPQIRKLEWMIHTVPLKSKLTVTQCLDPWDSILKSWFSILKTFEDGVSRHDDQGSSFNVRVRKYYDLLVRVHLLKVYTKLLF